MRIPRLIALLVASPALLLLGIAWTVTGLGMLDTAQAATTITGRAAWTAWAIGWLLVPAAIIAGLLLLARRRRNRRRLAASDVDLWRRLAHETGDAWAEQQRMVVTSRDADGAPAQILLRPGPRYPLHDPKAPARLAQVFAAATLRQPGAVTGAQDGMNVWLTVKTSRARAPQVDQPTRASVPH